MEMKIETFIKLLTVGNKQSCKVVPNLVMFGEILAAYVKFNGKFLVPNERMS